MDGFGLRFRASNYFIDWMQKLLGEVMEYMVNNVVN